jgi:hypothetical protein
VLQPIVSNNKKVIKSCFGTNYVCYAKTAQIEGFLQHDYIFLGWKSYNKKHECALMLKLIKSVILSFQFRVLFSVFIGTFEKKVIGIIRK